jgi:hypothetical protein
MAAGWKKVRQEEREGGMEGIGKIVCLSQPFHHSRLLAHTIALLTPSTPS